MNTSRMIFESSSTRSRHYLIAPSTLMLYAVMPSMKMPLPSQVCGGKKPGMELEATAASGSSVWSMSFCVHSVYKPVLTLVAAIVILR